MGRSPGRILGCLTRAFLMQPREDSCGNYEQVFRREAGEEDGRIDSEESRTCEEGRCTSEESRTCEEGCCTYEESRTYEEGCCTSEEGSAC